MEQENTSGDQLMPPQPLPLEIELVPAPLWGINMRKALTTTQWDNLRHKVYADHNHRCAICGADGQMNCHELWSYDDDAHIQRLDGFTSLCSLCHHIKHIGHANILASQGKLDFEQVVEHYMRVNHCTRAEFERHRTAAYDQWSERGRYDWTTDYGEYTEMVEANAAKRNKRNTTP
jgi:hypothetical protein